jgi:hypothetical protein
MEIEGSGKALATAFEPEVAGRASVRPRRQKSGRRRDHFFFQCFSNSTICRSASAMPRIGDVGASAGGISPRDASHAGLIAAAKAGPRLGSISARILGVSRPVPGSYMLGANPAKGLPRT